MKITFLHFLALCCILFFTLTIGYLADDLFNKQWYGYIFLGMTLSFALYTFRVQKKLEVFPEMPVYYKFALVFLFTLLTCLSFGFMGKLVFGVNFYWELIMGAVLTNVLNYNQIKPKIKKQ